MEALHTKASPGTPRRRSPRTLASPSRNRFCLRRARASAREAVARERREAGRFFNHELWYTTQYVPDVEALKASPTRVLVGLGVESGHLLTHQTSTVLAGLLGNATVAFPGDHGGFMEAPTEFADALRKVLA